MIAALLRIEAALREIAPCGTDDLFGPRLQPTPRFVVEKRSVFEARAAKEQWRALAAAQLTSAGSIACQSVSC